MKLIVIILCNSNTNLAFLLKHCKPLNVFKGMIFIRQNDIFFVSLTENQCELNINRTNGFMLLLLRLTM